MMAMGKKEMGLAVRALAQYASDCAGNGEYIEMKKTFDVAKRMAGLYELREEEQISNLAQDYLSDAIEDLEYDIEAGEYAKNILSALKNK